MGHNDELSERVLEKADMRVHTHVGADVCECVHI